MVWAAGFEPTAYAVRVRRSTKLSYAQAHLPEAKMALWSGGSGTQLAHNILLSEMPTGIKLSLQVGKASRDLGAAGRAAVPKPATLGAKPSSLRKGGGMPSGPTENPIRTGP